MTLCVMHYASPNRMPAMFITLAVALIMILLTDIAAAQSERDADFQAYCRAKHPNSSHQRTGLTHHCRQPGKTTGFVNHNIDLAEACRMTTGNASFRSLGTRIICAAGSGPAPTPQQASPGAMDGQPVGPPDFARYCRTRYTNSTYLKRTRSWGTEHLCRQPGRTTGFVFHNIDMADACRTTRDVTDYRIDGATVTCIRGSETDSDDQHRAGGGSGPGPKPGPVPPGPKPGPVPNPGPNPQPDPSTKSRAEVEAEVRAACKNVEPESHLHFSPAPINLGGDLKAATMNNVEPLYSHYLKVMREKKDWDELFTFRRNWGFYKRFAYNAIIEVLRCNISVIRNSKYFNFDEIKQSKVEACEIRKTLSTIFPENKAKTVEEFKATLDEAQELNPSCGAKTPDSARSTDKKTGITTKPIPVETKTLSDKDFIKEIKKHRAAIDALKKEMAKTRKDASYPGVDAEPLKRDIESKYDKKKKETEEKKHQLDLDYNKEREEKQLPSDCSPVGCTEIQEVRKKYDKKKKRLDEELGDYKDNLDDELIKNHGDDKSRKNIERDKLKLKELKNRQAKLDAEEEKRIKEAEKREKKVPPPSFDDDEPLIPDEALPDAGETTTTVINPDGSRTVTTTDKDGNILSREKIR